MNPPHIHSRTQTIAPSFLLLYSSNTPVEFIRLPFSYALHSGILTSQRSFELPLSCRRWSLSVVLPSPLYNLPLHLCATIVGSSDPSSCTQPSQFTSLDHRFKPW